MNDVNRTTAAPAPTGQYALFQWLRWRTVANAGTLLLGNSRVRLFTLLGVSAVVGGAVYAASAYGFSVLNQANIPFAGGVIGMLFDFLFLALGMMLVFSTGIILYSSLFSATETGFLLSTPAREDQVFAYKFQTALGFSSWAFLLLSTPILVAYGVEFQVPWYFYALLPPYFVGFLVLPGALGALACLLAVNYWPRRKKLALAGAVLVAVALLALWGSGVIKALGRQLGHVDRDALQDLFSRFAFAQSVWVPSHWLTRGLQAAARGQVGDAAYALALLWFNGLFVYVIAAAVARRVYRRGYNRRSTGGTARRQYRSARLDRVAAVLLAPFDRTTRILIEKDFRTFRRDPAQWGQLLIFAGLVSLYALNFQQFLKPDINLFYRHGVSLLNLTATAILMCAYMGRFIFPMLSLEGRKFWVLGLLPLSRDQLLKGKFVFAAAGAVIVAEVLMLTGDVLLGMPREVVALHALTVAVLALGLAGLSVGLGACMPNFKESDPSKITVGVGGTLNLVAGLLYLLLIVGLMAAPYHLQIIRRAGELVPADRIPWVPLGVLLGLVVGAAAVYVPMRAGSRALRRMEF